MVFFFEAKDGTMLYMGKDKYENEDLIKYGWPEDIWFHVDNLSSAHVYARLPRGATMADMTEDLIRDCAQLVKANSIEGCKKASVMIVYTPWSNLKKDGGMEVGQVGFHNNALVRKYLVAEKDKDVLRRIGKSKDERHPDLAAERERRDTEERAGFKAASRAKAAADKQLKAERVKEKEERSYDRLFGSAEDREKAEKERRERLAKAAAAALASGGAAGGGGGGGLDDDFASMGLGADPSVVTAAVAAAEEDFM